MGCHSLFQGTFPTWSSALQVDSLPSEPPGKPATKPAPARTLCRKASSIFRLCDHQTHFVKQPYLLDLNWWQVAESQQLSVGNGNPFQYSCLENSMDRGAWQATVHEVPKSRTRLSDFTFTFHLHALEKEMATHSSVLAWRIPGTGEPGGLLSMGLHIFGHD